MHQVTQEAWAFASDVADDTANTATPTFAGTIDTDAELAELY